MSITWILILTLYVKDGYSGNAVVTPVSGFNTQQACLNAGNDWLRRTNAQLQPSDFSFSARALCVPTTERSER